MEYVDWIFSLAVENEKFYDISEFSLLFVPPEKWF